LIDIIILKCYNESEVKNMKVLNVYMPDDVHKSLKLLCIDKNVSMTKYIVDIIVAAIKESCDKK